MKEELKSLIRQFHQETQINRSEQTSTHEIAFEREPTFQDFISWLFKD